MIKPVRAPHPQMGQPLCAPCWSEPGVKSSAECFMALFPNIRCGPLSPESPYSFNRSIHYSCLRAVSLYLSPSDSKGLWFRYMDTHITYGYGHSRKSRDPGWQWWGGGKPGCTRTLFRTGGPTVYRKMRRWLHGWPGSTVRNGTLALLLSLTRLPLSIRAQGHCPCRGVRQKTPNCCSGREGSFTVGGVWWDRETRWHRAGRASPLLLGRRQDTSTTWEGGNQTSLIFTVSYP